MNICICGGGSQGHISAGVIGSRGNDVINVLTRRPEKWSQDFTTIDLDGKKYPAKLGKISANPQDVIPQSDIVIISLPGFAIREELKKIKPYLNPKTIVGCLFGGSGFFLQALDVLGKEASLFALQRVPFTGRVREYGHSATLKGYKPYLKVATYNIGDPKALSNILEGWYQTPVYNLSHWLDATLSNSNPLLHPCRMRVMFKDWTPEKVYDRIPHMYNTDWDDESSECWVACDNELREIMKKLPMNVNEVPSVLDYYGCADIPSLTKKMQSIEPFKTVMAHMIEGDDGYRIDPEVRYFTEDIPFGLIMIKSFAEYTNTPTPRIDDVIYWAQEIMGKEYLVCGHLSGRDVQKCCILDDKVKSQIDC